MWTHFIRKRIQELIKQLETAESDLDKAMAVYELKEIDSPIIPLIMKKALRDESAEVRIAAVTSLHELTAQEQAADVSFSKYRASIPELTAIINNSDEDGEVKDLAIASLLNMSFRREDWGATIAVHHLKTHSDERVRFALLVQSFSWDDNALFSSQELMSLLKNETSEMIIPLAGLQLAGAKHLTEKEKIARIAAFKEAAERKDLSLDVHETLAELKESFAEKERSDD